MSIAGGAARSATDASVLPTSADPSTARQTRTEAGIAISRHNVANAANRGCMITVSNWVGYHVSCRPFFERRVGQATAKSLEPQFNNAVLLKCNASLFHTLANYRPGGGVCRRLSGRNHFPARRHRFPYRRNRPATQGLHRGHAINNGVGAMTFILRFIYREYCRSCFLHIRYL